MNKLILFTALAISFSVSTQGYQIHENKKTLAQGGTLIVPGSQKGTVLFANMQKIVPISELEPIVLRLGNESKLNILIKDIQGTVDVETATTKKAELKAQLVVFLVDCDKSPLTLLNAPEEGWAIVNVNAITKDAKNDVFRAARLRKEMIRGFFSVAGSMCSQYPNSTMRYIGKPSDLDKIVEEYPVDVLMRSYDNLKAMGVTPVQLSTYKRACQSGWAPAPTNDVQKKIWQEVHSAPSNPLRIEFDPAAQKGKVTK